MSDPAWNEPRVLAVVIDVIDEYLTPLEPAGDLDTERAEALRYYFEQCYRILKYPQDRPPRRPGQRDVFAAQAREDAAADREDTLLSTFHAQAPLTPHTVLVDLILRGLGLGSHSEHEDRALTRALRGYAAPDVAVGWPAFDTQQLAEHCRRSLELDSNTIGNAQRRAVNRCALTLVDPSGTHWLTELIRGVEILLYNRDCHDFIGSGSGKRTRQDRLLESHYVTWLRARHPDDTEDLSDAQLVEQPYYEADRAEFEHAHDRIQRMRTRFSLLYDILGPALLLDPTWTTQNCLLVSAPFVKLVRNLDKVITRDREHTELRRERTARSRNTLVSLVEHMAAGEDIKAYLEHFFNRCPAACMT